MAAAAHLRGALRRVPVGTPDPYPGGTSNSVARSRALPSRFKEPQATEYFRSMLEWARANPSRVVRRIICVPDDAMLSWARLHHAETRDISNNEVRAVDWMIEADALNLAIIDSSTVFLAFSGVSEQDIRGLSFKAELALTYFEVYFNQLWNAAMPLERGRCGSPMPASSDWRRCGWLRPGRSRPSPSGEAATAAAVLRPAVEPSAVQRRVERPRLGGNP
jgi:hypothetical protein